MIRRAFLLFVAVGLTVGASTISRWSGEASASSALSNVSPAASDFHMALIFNYNLSNKSVESGKVDYVWGAQAKIGTSATNDPASGVAHTYYTMFTEPNENNNLSWFQANHPDWLVYQCNGTDLAMVGDRLSLDVTNPAVQDYEMTWITNAMDGGYQGVGFDNTYTYNFYGRCGHYDQNGNWVKQYSGAHDDTAYRQAITTAFHQMTDKVRAAAASRGINFYITVNDGPNMWENQQAWYDLLPYTDVLVDEEGFTKGGYSAEPNDHLTTSATDTVTNQWMTKMQEYKYLRDHGKAWVIIDELPYTVDATHKPKASDVEWSLANYLLARGDHTYQATITGNQEYGGPLYMQPEYTMKIGSPTDDMYESQGAYWRDYTQGLAVVNPSPDTAYTVNLPAQTTYHDLEGKAYTGKITLPANGSGLVLIRQDATAVSTATATATNTATPTATAKVGASNTPTATATPKSTATNTPTATATPKSTATNTPSAIRTPTATATSKPRPTNTPTATATSKPRQGPPGPASTMTAIAKAWHY